MNVKTVLVMLVANALITVGLLSGYALWIAPARAPRLAVLATGDEVVPPEATPAPGQLRDSNSAFLLAAAAGLGLEATSLGIAPDRVEALVPLVERGLAADVLLLCGGVSAGEFDLVEGVLRDLGCRALFDAVAIQPGKPLVAAHVLTSVKGPNGGYRLARPATDISVLEVLEAVEGPIRGLAPSDEPNHPTTKKLEAICQQSADQIRRHFGKIKVADLNGRD